MEWVWEIYKKFVQKQLELENNHDPSQEELMEAFIRILGQSTVTILVQEPWKNAVRFKGLAKLDAINATELINDPMNYLYENFGGGKFKLNFHHKGWSFVGTRNFKPEGEPKWEELPEIDY